MTRNNNNLFWVFAAFDVGNDVRAFAVGQRKGTAYVRSLWPIPAAAVRPSSPARATRPHEQSGQAQCRRCAHAQRARRDLARYRCRSRSQCRDPGRRRQSILGRRRFRNDRSDHRRFRHAGAGVEGGARHCLQPDPVLETRGERHARAGGRGRSRMRTAGGRLSRQQGRPHHRRSYQARRGCR